MTVFKKVYLHGNLPDHVPRRLDGIVALRNVATDSVKWQSIVSMT